MEPHILLSPSLILSIIHNFKNKNDLEQQYYVISAKPTVLEVDLGALKGWNLRMLGRHIHKLTLTEPDLE